MVARFMLKIILTLIFVLSLLIPVSTIYAAGVWLYEGGQPDVGMATAGRMALANDATTAGSNPAGMTRLEGSQAFVAAQPLLVRMKFDADAGTTTAGSNGGDAGDWVMAGGAYYVHSVSPDLKLGLSFGSYFGLGIDYDDDWVGRYYVTEAEFISLGFNPTAAYRVNDWFSVGGGISVIYAELTQKAAINNVLDVIPDGELKLEDDDVGYGFNLGLLFDPYEGTRFGISYRSEVEIEFEDVLSIKGLGPGLEAALGGLVGSEVDLEMNIPQMVMASAYHELTDRLAITGNIGWQEWSEFGKSDITISAQNTTSFTQDRNYEDTWHFALGAQYRISDPWLLSAGIAYDESPVDDDDRTPDLPLDRQIRYAAGAQYEWDEDITLGFAYEYMDAGDAEIDQLRGPLAGRLKGEYDTNEVHFFVFNVNWKF
jgi:long-chain fatty acid transport protein